MNEAIRQAIESMYSRGLPFGAALYDENDDLIESAHNLTVQLSDPSLHAEIVLLSNLKGRDIDFSNTTLMTTCEPCETCFYTAYDLGIRTFIYGSTIETSRKIFPSDKEVKIEDLEDDIVVLQSDEMECDSLFSLYEDKKRFLPNSFFSKGTLREIYWMEVALKVAEEGMLTDREIPVGVIIVQENGLNDEELLTSSWTKTFTTNSPIVHGDVSALYLAQRKTYDIGKPFTMYSTLEPHLIGFGAAMKARLRKVVYGLEAWEDGGSKFFKNDSGTYENPPIIVGGVLRERQYELFKKFLEIEKDNKERVGYPYAKSMVDYYEEIYMKGDSSHE